MGKTNCGNEELAFLVSAIKECRTSRRRRLQMQSAFNNRIRFLNLVCLLLLLIPKGTSQCNCDEARPVRSRRRFLQDPFLLSFSLKNMTRSTPTNYQLSKPLHSHLFQIPNTACGSGLCTSSTYISCSRSKRNTYAYLPALLAILFQKIKIRYACQK